MIDPDPLHAMRGMPWRTPLLRAFAAGQGQSTTARWAPLLSLAVPASCPTHAPRAPLGYEGSQPGRRFIRTDDLVLAVLRPLDRPAASARHRGRDHDQDRRDDDADDPPDPVDAARRLNPQRCGKVVADEHAADPADNSQPERNVVAVPRREELAQQADDDAGDDHTDDVQRRPLSPVGDGLGSTAFASTRPPKGSIPDGNHGTTEGRGPF